MRGAGGWEQGAETKAQGSRLRAQSAGHRARGRWLGAGSRAFAGTSLHLLKGEYPQGEGVFKHIAGGF